MRIAILGSTGQVGSVITMQIKKDYPNAEILTCVRKQIPGCFLFNPFNDDWTKLGKLDILINSVGIIEEKAGMTFEKAHQGLTHLILKSREAIGNPRVIQLSVLGADVTSKVAFMYTKAFADDDLLKEHNTVVVRPSIVCTPRTMIVQKFKMLRGISRIFWGYLMMPEPMLRTKMQPVMGEDVAELVSKLCTTTDTGIINAAGASEITLGQLIAYLPGKIKIIKINRKLSDPVIKLLMKIFPSLINPAQYELLFKDNVADKSVAEKILGRPMRYTSGFWIKELN
jgi:uncharacterized protein YbjT (DUF2867 family)